MEFFYFVCFVIKITHAVIVSNNYTLLVQGWVVTAAMCSWSKCRKEFDSKSDTLSWPLCRCHCRTWSRKVYEWVIPVRKWWWISCVQMQVAAAEQWAMDGISASVGFTLSLIVSEGCNDGVEKCGRIYRPDGRLRCCASSSACGRAAANVADNSFHARERRRRRRRTCSRSRCCRRSRPTPSRRRGGQDDAACCSRTPPARRLDTRGPQPTALLLTSAPGGTPPPRSLQNTRQAWSESLSRVSYIWCA